MDPSLADVDLDAPGKQLGRLRVPLERTWQGRDTLDLPLACISNGTGPTVLLTGGNHGDEYEGPLVLGQLIRQLDPEALAGRLYILPALNLPALLAQQRSSPIDGKNLNRVWPGAADGTVTERIVHWLDTVLMARAQVFMDLHTGGQAMELMPMSLCHRCDDPVRQAASHACQVAFNAPLSVELKLGPDRATAGGRAHDRGLLVVGTESGGGGPVSPETLASCWFGVLGVLAHLEVLPAPQLPLRARNRTRFTRKWGHQAEMTATSDGIFVPFHPIGTEVHEGAAAGQLIQPEAPERTPQTLYFPASGLIAGRRATSGVHAGDVLFWIVQDR